MDKLREQLIEDIITYLDEVGINYPDNATIQNTVMQIIVDSFDEYEIGNQILIKK